MIRQCSIILVSALAVTVSARGDYTLIPQVDGESSAVVEVNSSDRTITLDLVLSSDAGPADTHTSAVFTVEFSKSGLEYEGITWAAPYATAGQDDWSSPANFELPTAMDADTWVSPTSDPGSIDLCLENFVSGNDTHFETGTIATLTITVPEDFPLGSVLITAVPDTLDNGLGTVAASGDVFTLHVVFAGDINGDGYVGQPDLDIVLDQWGDTVPAGTGGDINGDGHVGQPDLDVILDHWGDSDPPAAAHTTDIPAPVRLAMLALAAPVILLGKSRACAV